jgi:hypothetical protein
MILKADTLLKINIYDRESLETYEGTILLSSEIIKRSKRVRNFDCIGAIEVDLIGLREMLEVKVDLTRWEHSYRVCIAVDGVVFHLKHVPYSYVFAQTETPYSIKNGKFQKSALIASAVLNNV